MPTTNEEDAAGRFERTPPDGLTRRDALSLAVVAAGTLLGAKDAVAGAVANATIRQRDPRPASLMVRTIRPLNAEAPIAALRTLDTPNDLFFARSHFPAPETDVQNWTLTIDGDVDRPLRLRLADVRRMGAERRRVTIECAGNGRGRFALANTSGVQWGLGAVSTATWTGVPLAALLERAGARPSAMHFAMEGTDRAPSPATPAFLRSLPREAALGEAFVAYEMNGEPVPLQHGGPLRLLMPGWYGMASTKWLTAVHARATESDNHFMARGYRYPDGSTVDRMRVKSLVTGPLDGDRLATGTARATGVPWTGSGTVTQVEGATDGGRTRQMARLVSAAEQGAWRLWEADVELRTPGEQTIRARATDTAGHVQPERATPNPAGYGNNSIHEVRVHVG